MNRPNCKNELDPFIADFPHLIDIGIMGHCEHGLSGLCQKAGISCYQNGLHTKKPNMTLTDYQMIMDECKNKVFEVALGGRGDPDCHEHFEEILAYTKEKEIVPNFTTSGFLMTKEKAEICKKYCGAVAVSMYSRLVEENGKFVEIQSYTQKAIATLLDAGVKTNIHFVLSNHTIDEAMKRLTENLFPKGINAVVFLLHKPTRLGKEEDVLKISDEKVKAISKSASIVAPLWALSISVKRLTSKALILARGVAILCISMHRCWRCPARLMG